MRVTGPSVASTVLILGLITAAASGQDATGQASRLSSPQTKLVSIDQTPQRVSIDDIATRQYRSACRIDVSYGNGTGARGTGTYIGDRWILTAKHVVEDGVGSQGQRLRPITDCTFGEGTYRADEIIRAADCDAALVRLSADLPSSIEPIPLASSDPPVGSWICFAGFDRGERFRVYDGLVARPFGQSAQATHDGGKNAISGNSGGPVFDSFGRLVGNLHSKSLAGEWFNGVYYHTPDPKTTSYVSNAEIRAFFERVEQRYPQYDLPDQQFVGNSCPPSGGCPPGYRPIQPQPIRPEPIQPQPCPPGPAGPQGPIGLTGPTGPQGPPGKDCDCDEATIQALVDARVMQLLNDNPITLQPSYRDTDGTLKPDGKPIIARLGDRVPLPPVKLEVTSVDGRKSYSQGPLGGTMRVMMGEVK